MQDKTLLMQFGDERNMCENINMLTQSSFVFAVSIYLHVERRGARGLRR